MKKVIFVLLIIHCLINTSNSQWIQQNSGTTADLYSIKFINRYSGWACGPGVILKTTNSGNNWVILNLPVSKPFQRIHPVDSNVVYCVGMFESIIKTTNGGANWQVIRDGIFGVSNSFFCCNFINQNTGWIAGGGDRKILKTTNGGATFDSIVTYTSGILHDIYFRNSLDGLYCDDNGAVRKTTNGGYNWFSINIPVGTISYDFRNFSFINNQTGWTVTFSGNVFRTTDFGSNWDSISYLPNGGYSTHNIFFVNNNIGYTAGAGYFLYRSTNGGYNWIQHYLPYPFNGAHSFFFINDTVGWKVANSGRICYTTNGGQNTQLVNSNEQIIKDFDLNQNYPNPFNNITKIRFNISKLIEKNFIIKNVNIKVFNILGQEIASLIDEVLSPGIYEVYFDGSNLSSGVYYYNLYVNGKMYDSKKLVLLK